MTSQHELKQHHETDILAQESTIWRSEQNRSRLAQILRPVEPRGLIARRAYCVSASNFSCVCVRPSVRPFVRPFVRALIF